MCYLEGSKLSKKSTFKFVPIRNGIEVLAATCAMYDMKKAPKFNLSELIHHNTE